VTVIFKDLIEESLLKTSKFINNNKILVRYTSFLLVAVLALVISIVSCGIKIGYNVEYSGKNIAVVDDVSVFETAKDIVLTSLKGDNTHNVVSKPKFKLTVTSNDNLFDDQMVADAIIENTEEITFSSAITINGEVLAYGERSELKNLVSQALNKYYVEGATNTSTFVDEVNIEEGCCLKGEIKTIEQLGQLVNSLKVRTVSTVTTESAVKYSTKTVYTSTKERGYEKIKTKGVKGVKSETAVVETINGKETAKTVIARKVIKQPVQKVVVKGTASSYAKATATANARSQGFIHPMNRGDIKQVSAYWGDGRGHQAMDFSGNVGKPIFASKGGRVVEAGWDGAYGYMVVIDHGKGYKTRYAHASALCVKRGQLVTQGQQIAKLGNTGRSTGPHLHFEVIKNGVRVNPAPYIGY